MISLKSIIKDNEQDKTPIKENVPETHRRELLNVSLELIDYINQVLESTLIQNYCAKTLNQNLTNQEALLAKQKEILASMQLANTSDTLKTLSSLNEETIALSAELSKAFTNLEQTTYINFNDILSFLTQLRFILQELKTDTDFINE